MLWIVSVARRAPRASPTIDVFRKPSRPAATRTIPASVAQPIAVFVLLMGCPNLRCGAVAPDGRVVGGREPDGARPPCTVRFAPVALRITERRSTPRWARHEYRARASTHGRRGTTVREWTGPRMPAMPATMDGARFVGRDAAFIRLAPALEAAAGGDATTVLLEGPGGVGVTRFVDEVGRRVGRPRASRSRCVRGRSYRPGADEPYGPIVRALRPVFRERRRRRSWSGWSAPAVEDVVRLFPEIQAPARRRGGAAGAADDHRPERRQGRVLEGDPRRRRPAVRAAAGPGRPRGPPRRGRRHPRARDVPEPDPARTTASASSATLRVRRADPRPPAERDPRRDRGAGGPRPGPDRDRRRSSDPSSRSSSRRSRASARPPRPSSSSPTGRAACRSSPRSCSAARREVSDASLTGSFDDLVIARLAATGPECRRVLRLLALAGRPARSRRAGRDRGRVRADRRSPPAALVDPARGAATAPSIPDLQRGPRRGDRARHPASRRRTGSRSATSTSGGRPPPTCCRASAIATTSRSRPASSPIPAQAARHWIAAHVAGPGVRGGGRRRRPGRGGPRPGGRPEAPSSSPSALVRARPVGGGGRSRSAGHAGNRRRPRSADVTTPLQLRAAEAAFAAGRPARAVAYLEAILGCVRRAAGPRRARRPPRAARSLPARGGRSGRRPGGIRAGGRPRARTSRPSSGRRVVAALAQARMIDGSFAARGAARPRGDADRRPRSARTATAIVVHATTTLGVALGWGDEPEAGVALLEEARGLAEQRAATSTSCSGSTPT